MAKAKIKTTKKVRDPMRTYRNKIRKITKWYNNMVRHRQNTNGQGRLKKELRPLKFFTDKVKIPKE